jgi:hypothetical protein
MIKSSVVNHKIQKLEVGDYNGSIGLVLLDQKMFLDLSTGANVKIVNRVVISFKGVWGHVGKYGDQGSLVVY